MIVANLVRGAVVTAANSLPGTIGENITPDPIEVGIPNIDADPVVEDGIVEEGVVIAGVADGNPSPGVQTDCIIVDRIILSADQHETVIPIQQGVVDDGIILAIPEFNSVRGNIQNAVLPHG